MAEDKEVIHTEPIDSGIGKCPRCGSNNINWVFTKSGLSLKCLRCEFDTHYIRDVLSHRKRELEALPYLKAICPNLNFLENTDYGWEYLFEPQMAEEEGRQGMIYDCKVFMGGYKLERIKISIVQNTTFRHYVIADEQYLQGRKEVFEKLARMDALLVLYFPQDPDTKIAVAYCKELNKWKEETTDRFKNKQWTIPKAIRPLLYTADTDRIKEMLHRNLFKQVFKKRYLL
jgi:hypothetical protein